MLTILRRFLAPRTAPVAQHLWEAQLHRFPQLLGLPAPMQARMRELCEQFLGQKTMTGAGGLVLTADMQLHIAAQACLPIVHLGLHWYRGWRGIVVYPSRFRVRRRVVEDNGLEHEFDEALAGEAWDGGPVVLSWEDSAAGADAGDGGPQGMAVNVVIHEFAHTLDLLDGAADGIPPFDPRLHAGLAAGPWSAILDDAYERFCAELDLLENELPAHIDPDSAHADPYFARLPLDPYAASDPAEFFAVSSEALFMDPARLRASFPAWHDLLRRFYRLDAAAADAPAIR